VSAYNLAFCTFHTNAVISRVNTDESSVGFSFRCSAPDGAILTLPDGASREDFRAVALFREYAARNAKSWYQYVNGPRGRDAENGSLYLITGCDKSKFWGVASFSGVSRSFNLTFSPTAIEGNTNRPFKWEHASPASTKCGPVPPEYFDGDLPQNQCTFIRGFKIALGEGLRATLFGSVASVSTIVDAKPSDILTKSSFIPFGGASRWLEGNFPQFAGGGWGYQENVEASEGPAFGNMGAAVHDSDIIITADAPPTSYVSAPL
jgi:hypothetical protein